MRHEYKLRSTRRKLTFIFTGVVLFIVLFMGNMFLLAKYFQEKQSQITNFSKQTERVYRDMQNDRDFMRSYIKKIRQEQLGKLFESPRQMVKKQELIPINFIILDEDERILLYNIYEEPRFGDVDYEKRGTHVLDGTLIKVMPAGDGVILFYESYKLPFSMILVDMFQLSILCLLFGGLFYFIGRKFVGQVLEPVAVNLQDMKDFIHNAGHELKTPLAVMRGNMQIMQAEKAFDAMLLQENIRELDKTNALIEGLRELADAGKLLEKERLNLSECIEEIFGEFEQLSKEKYIAMGSSVDNSVYVTVNRHELFIVLSNLIKNAIKYNKENGVVSLSYRSGTLYIKDTGVGVVEKDREKIFDRLYKGENARRTEGFGIGLSLVKKICDSNGWKILLIKSSKKGSVFALQF